VLAVSDPAVVSSVVDGVVVTMRLRRNIKPLAARTLSTLEAVDAPIIGVVINGVSAEAAYGGYGYNYSYNDYRYSYRYSENNYSYGKYREYSAGYVEDDSEQTNAGSDNANSAT
jgi:Mrp family chromosome partitioning ATPase